MSFERTPSPEAIQTVLEHWNHQGPVQFLRKVENFVYDIVDRDRILRITHSSHRNAADINAELSWIQDLHRSGLNVARPVETRGGELWVSFEDQGETFFAVVFVKATGNPIGTKENVTDAVVANWAQFIGRLHRQVIGVQTPQRPQWDRSDGVLLAQQSLNGKTDGISQRFCEQLDEMKIFPKSEESYGLIHGDLHPGNFFVDQNSQLTVFDFDDCHYQWFVYDIAVAIYSLMYISEVKGEELDLKRLYELFLSSYQKEFSLSSFWSNQIPFFIQFRSRLMYFWIETSFKKQKIGSEHVQAALAHQQWSLQIDQRNFLF